MDDRTISHYRIVEKLGEGGMGVVYKAEDKKLRRTVALKFLRQDLLQSGEHKERFLREAQAAAALDHPNICTVFEIDEVEGEAFLAMAFVEGSSLKDKIGERPRKIEEALDLAIQTAEGLQAAHEKGIVHRDIKPANLRISSLGQVKILDFGLAQLGDRTRLTRTATILGTPAYMSPEQVQRLPTDRRTDIWSLGVVIYEMVTGRHPFHGEREQAVLYSIVHEEPEPMTALRVGIPPELDRIVGKALAKQQSERFQHVDDMRIDLQAVLRSLGESRTAAVAEPFVAVLPFVNLNRDEESEFFSDGITEDIIISLTKIPGLRVAARSSVFQFKGKQPDVREVGRKLNVGAVLEGTVRRAGNRLRVTAELVGVSEGYPLWSERYDRVMDDVFDIQDEISRAIREKLQVHLLGRGQTQLMKRHTTDVEAYKIYLKGRYWWNRRTQGGLTKARDYFARAIERDPGYALAYTGLGDCYAMLAPYDLFHASECFPKGKAAQLKALEFDPNLAAAHAGLGFVELYYDWDPLQAEKRLLRAIDLDPKYPSAHQWYAFSLAVTDRLDEALAELDRANELDPLSVSINFTAVWPLYWGRRFDEAIDRYRQVVYDHPEFWNARYYLGLCLLQNGQAAEAIGELEMARGMSDHPTRLCGLSYAYAVAGREAEALEALQEMIQVSQQQYVSASRVAAAYVGLGEKDRAFEWLEKALADRCWDMILIGMEPMFDPVRSDPRFGALWTRICSL